MSNPIDVDTVYEFYTIGTIKALLNENSLYQAFFFADNELLNIPRAHKVVAALIIMSLPLVNNPGAADQFRMDFNKFFDLSIDGEALRQVMSLITTEMQDEHALYPRKPKYGK